MTIADMSRNGSGPTPEPSLADLHEPLDWRELWSTTTAEPDWLIPGILERGRLHAIYAPKKQKKSLLTLLMVASLVTGRPLLGRPNPHGRKLRVLYIDIENARDDIRQRLNDAGYGPDDLAQLTYFSFPSLPGLDSPIGGAHLLSLVERYQPDLLVLDTTSRVVTGKENDADTFRSLYRHALVPVKARRVAILRLDHAGKDVTLGQRGSSAKGDDLDTAWFLTVRGPDRLTLRLDFQRTNHHPAEIELAQYGSPLRFVRIDTAADRPEVAELIARLDGLGVPPVAGRTVARKALTTAGIKAADLDLNAAIKIRKTCAEDQRTGTREDDLYEIINTCAEAATSGDECAGETCSAQGSHSPHSFTGSNTVGAVRDLPVSRSAQVKAQHPRTVQNNLHSVDFASVLALLNRELGATVVER